MYKFLYIVVWSVTWIYLDTFLMLIVLGCNDLLLFVHNMCKNNPKPRVGAKNYKGYAFCDKSNVWNCKCSDINLSVVLCI